MQNQSVTVSDRFAIQRVRAFAVLLALVVLQVSYATHQFEHSVGDITNVCGVCLQLDRVDDVIASTAFVIDASAGFVFPPPANRAGFVAGLVRTYQSRAPPLV